MSATSVLARVIPGLAIIVSATAAFAQQTERLTLPRVTVSVPAIPTSMARSQLLPPLGLVAAGVVELVFYQNEGALLVEGKQVEPFVSVGKPSKLPSGITSSSSPRQDGSSGKNCL